MYQNVGIISAGSYQPPADPIFKTTLTDAASVATGGSYSFASVDIGEPHPNRQIILIYYKHNDNTGIPTINSGGGDVATSVVATCDVTSSEDLVISKLVVPTGKTATIKQPVSGVTQLYAVIGVIVSYPASSAAIDSGFGTSLTTSPFGATSIATEAEGFIVVGASKPDTSAVNFTGFAWSLSGTPVTYRNNTVFDSAVNLFIGVIQQTAAGTTGNVTIQGPSGSKGLVAASFGAV